MTKNRALNLIAGWSFILLGVAGMVLPVLQGFLFLVVGLLFLSREYHWAHQLLAWLRGWLSRHFPRTLTQFERAEHFMVNEVHKMATETGYLRKRAWVIIAVIAGLVLFGWAMDVLVVWVYHLIFTNTTQ